MLFITNKEFYSNGLEIRDSKTVHFVSIANRNNISKLYHPSKNHRIINKQYYDNGRI